MIKEGAERSLVAIVMPNLRGPGCAKRIILCGVVHSIDMYEASVWSVAP